VFSGFLTLLTLSRTGGRTSMSKRLEEFLALRQASAAGACPIPNRRDPDRKEHQPSELSEQVRVYDATECRLVPGRTASRTGAEPERRGEGIAE
jgi:hypothetical protein